MAYYLSGQVRASLWLQDTKKKKGKPVSSLAIYPLMFPHFSNLFLYVFLVSVFPFILFPKCCCCLSFLLSSFLEPARNLVEVSALRLALEETEGCPRTMTPAYCSPLIFRVRLFNIKILLLLNFSIWGFPQSFPEAEGASWSCAHRARCFLQRCHLPAKPLVSILPAELPRSRKTRVWAGLLCWRQPVQGLCAVTSLTRIHPEDVDERLSPGLKNLIVEVSLAASRNTNWIDLTDSIKKEYVFSFATGFSNDLSVSEL